MACNSSRSRSAKLAAAIGDEQQAEQLLVASLQPDSRQVAPSQHVGQGQPNEIAGAAVANVSALRLHGVGQGRVEPFEHAIALRHGAAVKIYGFQGLSPGQGQGGGATVQGFAGAAGYGMRQFRQSDAGSYL